MNSDIIFESIDGFYRIWDQYYKILVKLKNRKLRPAPHLSISSYATYKFWYFSKESVKAKSKFWFDSCDEMWRKEYDSWQQFWFIIFHWLVHRLAVLLLQCTFYLNRPLLQSLYALDQAIFQQMDLQITFMKRSTLFRLNRNESFLTFVLWRWNRSILDFFKLCKKKKIYLFQSN